MNIKNNITIGKQDANTDSKSILNVRAAKRLSIYTHILSNPQGVSEKSINSAAHVMSGRNYPTDLQRKHDVKLVSPHLRLKDSYGCHYSVYRLLNAEQAHKLVKIIINHCKHHKLACPFDYSLIALADNFPDLAHNLPKVA